MCILLVYLKGNNKNNISFFITTILDNRKKNTNCWSTNNSIFNIGNI